MLWNWYTIDTCFIARSWHIHTRGAFAGSCIGVFFLVLASQWLNRFSREYDNAIKLNQNSCCVSPNDSESSDLSKKSSRVILGSPELYTLSHKWMSTKNRQGYPTLSQHVLRSLIFTFQWGVSYIIMLLFMYYNGYIIISCVLGAFFGRLFFAYESLSGTCDEADEDDRKCCRG